MRTFRISLFALLTGAIGLSLAAVPAQAGWFDRGIKGSGDIVTENREVDEFRFIDCNIGADLDVKVGEKYSLTISVDDNLMDNIKTEVRGKTLEIYAEKGFSSRRGCRIEITVAHLEGIDLSGSGDIRVSGLKEEEFEFDLSGSADVYITGDLGRMEIDLSGSGDVELVGTAKDLDLSIAGSGDIDAREMHADKADVKISGSGDVKVFVNESLYGRVSGSGDIDYWGNPRDVSSKVQGSGSIQKRG